MLKKYSKKSLLFGLIGIAGEFAVAGIVTWLNLDKASAVIDWFTLIVYSGFAVMIAMAFYYYLKAKGRSPFWLLLLVFNVIGLLILASLKDKYKVSKEYKGQYDQIVEAIKANPSITFEEVKQQALNAGLPEQLIITAWENSKF